LVWEQSQASSSWIPTLLTSILGVFLSGMPQWLMLHFSSVEMVVCNPLYQHDLGGKNWKISSVGPYMEVSEI
jgi:hypothetical protein